MTQSVTPEPLGDEPRFPVFFDESGRRRRWLRIVGWVVGAIAAAYVVLFAVSVVSSPSLLPLTLPGIGRLLPTGGAPDIKVPGHGHQGAATVVATSSPRPTARPSGVVGTPRLSASPSPASVRSPVAPPATPRAHPTGKPTTVPSAVPTVTPASHGSPTAHTTPRGTGRPTAKPTGQPTAQPTSSHGHSHTPSPHPHGASG